MRDKSRFDLLTNFLSTKPTISRINSAFCIYPPYFGQKRLSDDISDSPYN